MDFFGASGVRTRGLAVGLAKELKLGKRATPGDGGGDAGAGAVRADTDFGDVVAGLRVGGVPKPTNLWFTLGIISIESGEDGGWSWCGVGWRGVVRTAP